MWDPNGSALMEQTLDLVGHTRTAGLAALLVAATALFGVIFVCRRLGSSRGRRIARGTEPTASSRRESLEISRSAAALLDRFRDELATLQFARGADAAVMERLDGAVALLRETGPDPAAGFSQAEALQSVAGEIRAMRLAYASTWRQLNGRTESLEHPTQPIDAAVEQDGEPEYDAVAQTARRAIAALERAAAERA